MIIMEIFLDLNNLRIFTACFMLIVVSYLDIRNREVNDVLWIGFAIFSLILIFFEPNLVNFLNSLGFSLLVAPVVLIAWRFGIFGGADAFGIIVLAILVPNVSLGNNIVTPFTTLTNAAILSMTPFFINGIRNLILLLRKQDIFAGFDESKSKKLLAVFLGYRAQFPKYGFSIEKSIGGSRKFNFILHHAEQTEFCDKSDTWISQGTPFLVFIAIGFFIQLVYGDLLFTFLSFIK